MNWTKKYERIGFVNNSEPALNEANLGYIDEELGELHERTDYLYGGIVNVKEVFDATESLNQELEIKKAWVNTIVDAKDKALSAANTAQNGATTSTQQANLAKTYSVAAKASETNASESKKAAQTAADKAEQSADLAEQKAVELQDNTKIATEQAELAKTHRTEAGISADRAEQAVSQINEAVDTNIASFTLNLETGHMEYTGGRFNFTMNTDTGHLEWEVAV